MSPNENAVPWYGLRRRFWRCVESDLPERRPEETAADAIIAQSDRLRQRTGRACVWVAVLVGVAWVVVLTPHCLHLMKHPEWVGAKAAWLAVSAPPVALIAALLGMAERFFTPTHILHAAKTSSDEADNEISKAMGAGSDVVKPIEDLIKGSLPGG